MIVHVLHCYYSIAVETSWILLSYATIVFIGLNLSYNVVCYNLLNTLKVFPFHI
jgi:hypothetical protein